MCFGTDRICRYHWGSGWNEGWTMDSSGPEHLRHTGSKLLGLPRLDSQNGNYL